MQYMLLSNLLDENSNPIKDVSHLPPSISIRDVGKYQRLYLTKASLSLQAGHLRSAVNDVVRGIELVLCTSETGDKAYAYSKLRRFSFEEFVRSINVHIQLCWLEQSSRQELRIASEKEIATVTTDMVDFQMMKRDTHL